MESPALPTCFHRLPQLDDAWRHVSPAARLDAVRRATHPLRDHLLAQGPAVGVRTSELITFPYPARFGLSGVALSPAPYVMMTNRVQIVQVEDNGRLINILVNKYDPDRSAAAPFFAAQLERYGEFVSNRVISQRHGNVQSAIVAAGLTPEEIDYITFDHLHVQDLRGWLGTVEPEPGGVSPTSPYLPNAKLIAQTTELQTFAALHPLQRPWYVKDGLRGIPRDKIIAIDGDYMIGAGFALVRTPGHTQGNHTPVITTDTGLWTISENGIAVDSYAPAHSTIPGLRRHAKTAQVEVILNGNTREHSLDQYTSMILEKTLADPCRERPEFPQHFSSSELTRSRLAPGLSPTYTHQQITHGQLRKRHKRAAA